MISLCLDVPIWPLIDTHLGTRSMGLLLDVVWVDLNMPTTRGYYTYSNVRDWPHLIGGIFHSVLLLSLKGGVGIFRFGVAILEETLSTQRQFPANSSLVLLLVSLSYYFGVLFLLASLLFKSIVLCIFKNSYL